MIQPFDMIELGLDSFMVSAAVAPSRAKAWDRISFACALGAADGIASLAAASVPPLPTFPVAIGPILLACYGLLVLLLSRLAGGSLALLLIAPALLSLDNLLVPATPEMAAYLAITSASLGYIGSEIGIQLCKVSRVSTPHFLGAGICLTAFICIFL